MAIPKFEDFNKRVKDLFKDDYTDKTLLKIKHNAPQGVSVTAETEYASKGDKPLLPSKLTFKWKHASGFAVDKLQVKNNDGIVTETSMTGVAPGLKFTFKGDDNLKADLGVEYSVDNATVTGELDVVEFSRLRLSGVFGYQQFLLGGNLAYRLPGEKPSALDTYTLSAAYNASPVFASVGSTNLSTVDLHLHYTYQQYVLGAIVNHSLEGSTPPSFTLGGSYACSKQTSVRAKAILPKANTANTVLAAAVSHNAAAGVNVVGSVETALNNVNAAKLGLQITLG